MTIAELIEEVGGNAAFSRALGIPLKTVEGWKAGKHCAAYNVEAYRKALAYDQQPNARGETEGTEDV